MVTEGGRDHYPILIKQHTIVHIEWLTGRPKWRQGGVIIVKSTVPLLDQLEDVAQGGIRCCFAGDEWP